MIRIFNLRYRLQKYYVREGRALVRSAAFYRKKYYFQDDVKEPETQEDDPWAGLAYTVDLETGRFEFAVVLYRNEENAEKFDG